LSINKFIKKGFYVSKMKLRLNANAIIVNKEGKILGIKLKGGPYAGGICIPGGGINPGELSFDTIKREIKEETGIEIGMSPCAFGFCELMQISSQNHRVVLLLHSTGEGVPIETEEAIAEWMDMEYIKTNGIPFTKKAIEIWEKGEVHFTLIE